MGIVFAVIALLGWGFGGFLTQRSARKLGAAPAAFFISAFAAIILLPFVYSDLYLLADSRILSALLIASAISAIAILADLEGVRIGKLAVIEPVYALELPITVLIGTFFLAEILMPEQHIAIGILFLGTLLICMRDLSIFKRLHLERGILFALAAALAMGVNNIFFAVTAREVGPLLICWFAGTILALIMLGYIIARGHITEVIHHLRHNRSLVVVASAANNIGWIAFAFSALTVPISVAIGISEGYVALAALLGIFVGHEKLKLHQLLGLFLTAGAAIYLGWITN